MARVLSLGLGRWRLDRAGCTWIGWSPKRNRAGALTRAEFEAALTAAGLVEIEITETHRVHEHAASAIVRGRKRNPDRVVNGM